jgi:cysteine synthase A
VIVSIPDNQALEKYQMLEALGVDVRKFAPVPFANPAHFYHQAQRISAEMEGAFWANQFENTANAQIHYTTTGPEIWQQAKGQIDVFACAVGSGGTMGGVSRFLKEKNSKVRIVVVDPMGSGLFCLIKEGKIESQGSSITEGIGIMRKTANFAGAQVDDAVRVSDQDMVNMVYHLAHHDGLVVGTSAALNVFAIYQMALQARGSGQSFVTILCDHGSRYQARLFNPEWLAARQLTPRKL